MVTPLHLANFYARRDADPDRGTLPTSVRRELEHYLDRGILARGFCRVHCESCGQDALVGWSCLGRGFCRSCAGRSGQLLNLSGLGADCGISHNTAKAWLSVLEASYLLFHIHPWSRNHDKTLTKTPKLYFHDTGLLCYLLGIRKPEQIRTHPLRGAIFETWIVSEVMKSRLHAGETRGVHFYRNRKGLEVDLLLDEGHGQRLVEIKSGQTIGADFFDALRRVDELLPEGDRELVLIHGGDKAQRRTGIRVLPWNQVDRLRP